MMSLAGPFLENEFLAFASLVLLQCTVALALALLSARVLRCDAAVRQTVLRTGMLCAITCPFITLGLRQGNVTLISIPMPVRAVDTVVQGSVLSTGRTGNMLSPDGTAMPEPIIDASLRVEPSSQTPTNRRQNGHPRWQGIQSLVLIIWGFGFLASGYGIVRSWLKLRRLLKNTELPSSDSLQAAIVQARTRLKIRHFPQVVYSQEVISPVAAGIVRPRVILPAGFCERLSGAELHIVLLHEAAHIVQRDHVSLLLERLFTAVYWFHPLAYLLVRGLERAHEEVCDNYVLKCIDGPSYGETLMRINGLMRRMSPVPCGVGLFSLRWKLEERISGLLDERRKIMVRTNIMARVAIVVLMSLVVVSIGATKLVAEKTRPETNDLPPTATRTDDLESAIGVAKQGLPTVMAIVLDSVEQAQRVWHEASDNPTDQVFAELASQYSSEAGLTADAGQVSMMRNSDGASLIERAASQLKPGEISNVLAVDDKFVILRRRSGRVVAWVNGEAITQEELADHLLGQHGDTSLEHLVNRKILEQACREKGITISEEQMDAEVASVAQKFGLTSDEWYRMLEKERDLTAHGYRRDVIWPALVLKELAGMNDAAEYFNELRANAKVLRWQSPGEGDASNQWQRNASSAGTAGKPGRIVSVDVGRIIRESSQFNERTDNLKREIHQTQQQGRKDAAEIQSLEKALQALSSETKNDEIRAELKNLIERKKTQLQHSLRDLQKEFRERESAAYHDVYRMIYDEIRRYSKEHGIQLVLRDPGNTGSKSLRASIDPAGTDPTDSKAVLQQINQHIVYVDGMEANDGVDITDVIIKRLKSQTRDTLP